MYTFERRALWQKVNCECNARPRTVRESLIRKPNNGRRLLLEFYEFFGFLRIGEASTCRHFNEAKKVHVGQCH